MRKIQACERSHPKKLVEYITKGDIKKAQALWSEIDHSTLHSSTWYKMMKLYKMNGNDNKVFDMYKKYQSLNGDNDPDTFHLNLVMRLNPNIMKNPQNKQTYLKISSFIDEKLKQENKFNDGNKYLLYSLLDYYIGIGDMKQVITRMNKMDIKFKDTLLYNKIMAAYLKNDMNNEAIKLFFSNEMYNGRSEMIDDISCLYALKACTKLKDIENGKKIDNFISHNRKYNSNNNIQLFTTLLTFYGAIGEIEESIKIFDEISMNNNKDVTVVGAMMQAYLDNNMNENAIKLFLSSVINNDNASMMNVVTCILGLKACGRIKDEKNGRKIHDIIVNCSNYLVNGKKKQNIELLNTLITFYGKIGQIKEAMKIFNQINDKNKSVVCYSVMMQAYIDNHMNREAIKLFFSREMKNQRLRMIDHVCCLIALKACTVIRDKESGKAIHKLILNGNWNNIDNNRKIWSALITFYGKIGEIEGAMKIFNEIENKDKNIVCYNAMMQAYLENGMNEQVLKLFFSNEIFDNKGSLNAMINNVSYLVALQACGNGKNYYNQVKQIDKHIRDNSNNNNKHFYCDGQLVSQLISCYGKLGYIKECQDIFNVYLKLNHVNNDVDSLTVFSSMMNSYAQNYLGNECVNLFNTLPNDHINRLKKSTNMQDIEIVSILYTTLIGACSHSSLVNEAKEYYDQFNDYYNNILNKLIHNRNTSTEKINGLEIHHSKAHCALVDAFARKGLLHQAYQFCIKFENNVQSETSFLALLSGCKKFNNIDIARQCLKKIENLLVGRNNNNKSNTQVSQEYIESRMASSYVLMHNILTAVGQFDEANEIYLKRKKYCH